MKKNRWYDKHENLARHFESLQKLPRHEFEDLLKDLITFAELLKPDIFEEHLLDYPLDLKKRRWYDENPYLWIVINGLRFANDRVLGKVVEFFDRQIEETEVIAKKTIAVSKKPAAAVKKPATAVKKKEASSRR